MAVKAPQERVPAVLLKLLGGAREVELAETAAEGWPGRPDGCGERGSKSVRPDGLPASWNNSRLAEPYFTNEVPCLLQCRISFDVSLCQNLFSEIWPVPRFNRPTKPFKFANWYNPETSRAA